MIATTSNPETTEHKAMMKAPKTANEMRAVEACESYGLRVRAKRNRRNLPNRYNDVNAGDLGASWKARKRRAQWER